MGMDEKELEIVASLVGRTIVSARMYDESPDYDWTGHEVIDVVLDDGRTIQFGGWGHDAWGATIDLREESA